MNNTALLAQAAALRAWAAALEQQVADRETRAVAPKVPKRERQQWHDYKPFVLTPGMLLALRPKRLSPLAECCRHCGVVRTAGAPFRFWDGQWRSTKPACKALP
ncbi:MAG: hypothetical protein WDO74_37460 [Pseudomonadota bacterium]